MGSAARDQSLRRQIIYGNELPIIAPLFEPLRRADQYASQPTNPTMHPAAMKQLAFHHMPPEGRCNHHRSVNRTCVGFFRRIPPHSHWSFRTGYARCVYNSCANLSLSVGIVPGHRLCGLLWLLLLFLRASRLPLLRAITSVKTDSLAKPPAGQGTAGVLGHGSVVR